MCVVGHIWRLQFIVFFFQAEDGIRDLVRSRGLGDVYKRQLKTDVTRRLGQDAADRVFRHLQTRLLQQGGLFLLDGLDEVCLLYTSPSPRDRTRSRMPSSA